MVNNSQQEKKNGEVLEFLSAACRQTFDLPDV